MWGKKRILSLINILLLLIGGYWHGFIYAPDRWHSLPVGDPGAIAVGCLIGQVIYVVVYVFVDDW